MKSQKKKHRMEFYEMQNNNLVFKSYNILNIKGHMIAFIKL